MHNDTITVSGSTAPAPALAFDPVILMSSLGIAALFLALVAWQVRGSPNAVRGWLGWSALTLELLAGAMAITWASLNGQGLLAWIFVLGFVGMALAKASIVSAVGRAVERQLTGALAVTAITLILTYAVVYLAGSFAGTMESSGKAAAESLASAPIKALDAQITAARSKLEGLTDYADTQKATAQAASARRLEVRLVEERTVLESCPQNYITRCINPAQQRIRQLENELAGLSYHTNNQSYQSTQAHIARLETDRAALLKSGGIPSASGHGADDQMISWLLGVSVEKARDLKWLIFVLAFDILSLLFRLSGELISVGTSDSRLVGRRLAVLLDSGLPLPQAAAMLAGGAALQLPQQPYAHGLNTPEPIGNENDLYPVWLAEIETGKREPTMRPAKDFLNKNLCIDGAENTPTPAQMGEVAGRWLAQALDENIIEETGAGRGKAKYQLVKTP